MPALEQIAYVSRARVEMDSLLAVAELLAASQRNNWRDEITGALAYSDGRFFQVVEGRAEAVERLMRRVEADPRHAGVKVVLRRPIEERAFPDWAMAVPRVSPETAPLMAETLTLADAQPDAAIATLRRLTEIDAIHS
ncbi:BLUF domain-containing protein [Brevundimonas sp.]|uniref:BLUF domain-containing protein n=1 Tax=Brevundimonas sp. TaxID=1871086 RepID=UPI0022C34213|nr:BLUF domain-containing protein [Brevundimonas sp.]MCZ8193439.1 BLUF domain-containing protein [Brevundimonas sp.]